MIEELHKELPRQQVAGHQLRQKAAYASIMMGASLWGILGFWNRHLMAYGFSSYSIVALRNLGGLLILTLYILCVDPSLFRIRKEHLKYFFGTGIVSVLMYNVCYFSCQEICSLAIACILIYTAPAIVVILSAILWKETITRKKMLALILTLTGCACVTGVFAGGLTITAWGLMLGVLGGFFYALYSIIGRYALQHYSPLTVTYWTFVFCGIGSLFLLQPTQVLNGMAHGDFIFIILGLVVFSTALPYVLYTRGLAQIESGKASIMACVEPVVATLVGTIAFGEPISFMTGMGILCVLSGVYILH